MSAQTIGIADADDALAGIDATNYGALAEGTVHTLTDAAIMQAAARSTYGPRGRGAAT